MNTQNIYTYQTRLNLEYKTESILEEFAALFGKVERTLFSQITKGANSYDLKNLFLKKFGITARQYNSVRVKLDGKTAAFKERASGLIQELEEQIISLKKRIEKLKKVGQKNADKYGFVKKGIAEFYAADGSIGFPPGMPFDRILVSASTGRVPEELKRQLKIGGKMVIPIKNSIVYLEKKSETDFYKEEYPGFVFVPLV